MIQAILNGGAKVGRVSHSTLWADLITNPVFSVTSYLTWVKTKFQLCEIELGLSGLDRSRIAPRQAVVLYVSLCPNVEWETLLKMLKVGVEDDLGNTSLDIAMKLENQECIKLLARSLFSNEKWPKRAWISLSQGQQQGCHQPKRARLMWLRRTRKIIQQYVRN